MEIIFCIMIFFMGTVFGSFFTLAVYRIPLNLDITHERSFCPNCNHRLEFLDLIPIFSYLFLRGKCRYCGKPVRIRYLLLEIFSGLIFLAAYFAFKLTFPFFTMHSIMLMIAFVMFYITNAIILGIDKEYINIEKRVLLFGIITNSIYMLYLYIFEQMNIYRYGIYLAIMLILFIIDTITLKNKKKSFYTTQILILLIYELSFINNLKMIFGMCLSSIIVYIMYYLYRIYKKTNDKKTIKNDIPIGFCIVISSVASVLIGNFIM